MKTRKIYFWVFCMAFFGFFSLLPAAAQSNDIIDSVLQDPSLLYKDGAYLVLTAAGYLPDTVTPDEAFADLEARRQEWRLQGLSAAEPMTLGEYSYLLMQAFSIRGGVLYSIFPGARYAARELSFLDLIEGPASPYRKVSGDEALLILGRTLEWAEDRS